MFEPVLSISDETHMQSVLSIGDETRSSPCCPLATRHVRVRVVHWRRDTHCPLQSRPSLGPAQHLLSRIGDAGSFLHHRQFSASGQFSHWQFSASGQCFSPAVFCIRTVFLTGSFLHQDSVSHRQFSRRPSTASEPRFDFPDQCSTLNRRRRPKTFRRAGGRQQIRAAIGSPCKASSGLNRENLSDG
jgi:hypothetical protein